MPSGPDPNVRPMIRSEDRCKKNARMLTVATHFEKPSKSPRPASENRTAVPLAAGKIEHVLSLCERCREVVPVQVFVDPLHLVAPRHAPFASPFDEACRRFSHDFDVRAYRASCAPGIH